MNSKLKDYLRTKDWAQYISMYFNRRYKRNRNEVDIEEYLINDYRSYYGTQPDLQNPKKYSEFLLWQKLNMRDDVAPLLTDKIISKGFVKFLFGEEIHFPRTLKVFKNANEIHFGDLPNECVIKCNHNSGYVFHFKKEVNNNYTIKNLRDKEHRRYSLFYVKKILNKLLKDNYYYNNFEWNYDGIAPRVFIEEYLETNDLRDYKFYMSMGELICFHVVTNRQTDERNTFFDAKLTPLKYWADVPPAETPPVLPKNIHKMIEFAKTLSRDYPAVRIDLYNINERIYFSEVTFFHMGGHLEYKEPSNFDELMGENMTLPPNEHRKKI